LAGRPWQPWDVRDPQRLACYVLSLQSWHGQLTRDERDECMAFLMRTMWELSNVYDPEKDRALSKGRRPSFQSYAVFVLRLRIRDWREQTVRQRSRVVSLDQLIADDSGHPELAGAFAASGGDVEADSDSDFQRVVAAGSSAADRRLLQGRRPAA